MKIIKIFYFIIFLFSFSLLFTTNIFSQESDSDQTIIYFYQEDCSHCSDLDNIISENNLYEILDIQKKEISSSDNYEFFTLVSEKCGVQKLTPFIYYNEKCYIGTTESSEMLLNIAGISSSTSETYFEDDYNVIINNEEQNPVSTDYSDQSDEIYDPTVRIPDLSTLQIILMIIAPIIFITMAYLIITRLKL